MNPITKTLLEYDRWLKEGHLPVDPYRGILPEPHVAERKLHASALLLCDRKAAYSVMADLGEIEPDLPYPDEQLLDFRVGNMFEEFIAQAMEWKGALVEYQTRLTNKYRKGRLDLVIDPSVLCPDDSGLLWTVEVKTVKSTDPSKLEKYPADYQVAQCNWYVEHQAKKTTPVLYHALRSTFAAALSTFNWVDGDCEVWKWDEDDYRESGWLYTTTHWDLGEKIQKSEGAQEAWLLGGELPPRCGVTPDEHPFLCCNLDWKNRSATPDCEYFGQCWGTNDYDTFHMGAWKEDDDE